MSTPARIRRIVVTIDVADDPHLDVLAVQALLRLTEWLHHEGTIPARTALEITSPEPPAPT